MFIWLNNTINALEYDWSKFNTTRTNVEVIRIHNYDEFENYIIANGLPEGICFDHDLGGEKTGFDCTRFLTRYCMNYALPLPQYAFQLSDPHGQISMELILQRYEHFYDTISPPTEYSKLVADGFDNELPF